MRSEINLAALPDPVATARGSDTASLRLGEKTTRNPDQWFFTISRPRNNTVSPGFIS